MNEFAFVLIVLIVVLFVIAISSLPDEETRQARLRAEFEAKRTRLQEEAELCHAQIAVVQAQMNYDLVQSRVKYVRALSPRERGLLAARMKASAEAEAHKRLQLQQLEAENEQLTKRLRLTWDGRK